LELMASRTRFNLAYPLIFLALLQVAAVKPSLLLRIRDAAMRSSLDPKLVQAVVQAESNFKPRATSDKGAMGLMQVMPTTADECEIHDPYHAVNNLMGACDCLRKLINRYRGNVSFALAAYNAGPSNVDKYHGVPPFRETQAYVKKVMKIYDSLKK
jgi:soluble lytic murein transglycosylase-like protein